MRAALVNNQRTKTSTIATGFSCFRGRASLFERLFKVPRYEKNYANVSLIFDIMITGECKSYSFYIFKHLDIFNVPFRGI